MNENEFELRLRDLILPHLIYLQRYSNGFSKRALKTLNRALNDLQGQLASRLVKIEERGLDVGPTATKRLNTQIKEIRALVKDAYDVSTPAILDELAELAEDEAAFTVKAIRSVKKSITDDTKPSRRTGTLKPVSKSGEAPTPTKPAKWVKLEVEFPTASPAPTMVRSIVDTKVMSGKHLKAWADKLSTDTQNAVEAAIRDGMVQAKTTDEIVRDIIGSKRLGTTGVLDTSRRSAEALVRTAVSHIHNVAAQLSYAENDDVITGWKYLSTLDNRTTIICVGLSGRVYSLGKGPIPPNHVRCRSICQPVTLTMRELGIDLDEGTPLTRASADGPLAGDPTYDQWLKPKSPELQDAMLGKTRADLFRAGKLSLKDLVADDGRVLTLKQLRALHPDAF